MTLQARLIRIGQESRKTSVSEFMLKGINILAVVPVGVEERTL